MALRNVRMLKNIVLKVNCEGEEIDVPFSAGDIYEATKIEQDEDGFCDVYLVTGDVIKGVASKVIENLGGRVPVTQVEKIEPDTGAIELETEAPNDGPALLDGTMLSNEE